MSSFMAYVLSVGFSVLFGILIMTFVYIFKRYPIKTCLKVLGLISLLLFLIFTIIYIVKNLFGFIGIFILLMVLLIYAYKPVYEYRKELEKQYKNGKISKEERDRRTKEMAEFIRTISQLT